jgi:hypothetical protein
MVWQNKDWLDQPAHLAVGLILTFVLCFWTSWLESSVIVMGGAFVRELRQHDWDWRRVGVLDLTFFAIGCGLAAFFV